MIGLNAFAAASIVIVHGAFADGSGWEDVYTILKKDGYDVSIVQNPLTSFADDVAAAKRVIDLQPGPVVLVAHSYGGAVITEAGNNPKVAALVYLTAYMPDNNEPVSALRQDPPAGTPPTVLPPTPDGFLFIDKARFHQAFAADVEPHKAAFMADAQVPLSVKSVGGVVSKAAWRTKPSWFLVATEDHIIPPPLQRRMAARAGATVSEQRGSHAIYVSQPAAAAALIEKAAKTLER